MFRQSRSANENVFRQSRADNLFRQSRSLNGMMRLGRSPQVEMGIFHFYYIYLHIYYISLIVHEQLISFDFSLIKQMISFVIKIIVLSISFFYH